MLPRAIAAAIAGLLFASGALAVQPDEMLRDPVLEARARSISASLRCVVCQNQSIDDSEAPLARDLRIIVRERLRAGDSDRAVQDFVAQRYGSFVLLKPPLSVGTVLLWAGPGLVLALALVGLGLGRRRHAGAVPAPLSGSETARLATLLSDRPPG